MKKFLILFVLVSVGLTTSAQKKNGIVFIEHPAMEKIQQLWTAFENGDNDTYGSFLYDTVSVIFNGKHNKRLRAEHVENLDWWSDNFINLKVVVDKPAYADALEYKEGGVWVQDWLRIQGIHESSGINLDLQVHNLYSFNEDGKITSIHHYFNNDKFEEITNSETTRENGKVFIHHPYIANVRKLVNAYCSKDLDAMKEYFSPKATFTNTTLKMGEKNDLETQFSLWEERFSGIESVEMNEIGYPDCIYYAKNSGYVVYSWWVYKATTTDGGKLEAPLMLSHTFDDDGKITNSMGYWSSNHFE